ncbi:MAG: phosphoglucosamine mutase [Synergistaceae bacterium]|nr:phosphoglucosamine mutase [Synergistaceae bacterium]
MDIGNAKKIRRLFGTDGVRDIANHGMMTPEAALKLGRAYVLFLKSRGAKSPHIAVGRDTRHSGTMLESALAAGITSAGADVSVLGVIPTPGVSFAVAHNPFDGGAVISASHNPAEYNGIKFLDKDGFKLTDDDEIEIEEMLDEAGSSAVRPTHGNIGRIFDGEHYTGEYVKALLDLMSGVKIRDYRVAVDSANGAASAIVSQLFEKWGGKVTLLANEPDGMNINDGVGVTHMDYLCAETVKNGVEIGIAYDGDTDRVLMCDSKGRVIDGDIILWVIGRWLAKKGTLGSGLVATVMSNMVLEDLLLEDDIKVFRCGVGDRYVLDTMRREECRLGGEQSGHIIALDYANTGDGLCSGTLFLNALAELEEDVSTLVDRFNKYPQVLRNLRIKDKSVVMNSPRLAKAAAEVESMLAGKGRMLLRPSGTEPLVRIFVESRDADLMNRAADILQETITEIITMEG